MLTSSVAKTPSFFLVHPVYAKMMSYLVIFFVKRHQLISDVRRNHWMLLQSGRKSRARSYSWILNRQNNIVEELNADSWSDAQLGFFPKTEWKIKSNSFAFLQDFAWNRTDSIIFSVFIELLVDPVYFFKQIARNDKW